MINLSRFDLNLLVVLNAIAEEGSITGASLRLNLTQSAVSHALSRLRTSLDDPLFTRRGGAMVPTSTARSILDPVRKSLDAIENSLNQINGFNPSTTSRTFRVGMRHGVEWLALPRVAMRLRALAPASDLVVVTHDRGRLHLDLASGAIDLAIDSRLTPMPHVVSAPLVETELLVACRAGHPLIGEAGTLDMNTYLSLEHILASSRRSGPALEDFELAKLGLSRRVVVRCANPWSALQTVARTDLSTTVNVAEAKEIAVGFNNVRFYPFPSSVRGAQVLMYWSDARTGDQSLSWLRSEIEAAFSDVSPKPQNEMHSNDQTAWPE